MIIENILGNIKSMSIDNREIDFLRIEWFETNKRIQRKKTDQETEFAIRFLKEGQRLHQGDILFMNDTTAVIIDINPTDAISIVPRSIYEMGSVCYEIGNKHLPLFIQNDHVLLPFEDPIFRWLIASGYQVEKVETRLLEMLNSNVQPHGPSGSSLFTKILGLVSNAE